MTVLVIPSFLLVHKCFSVSVPDSEILTIKVHGNSVMCNVLDGNGSMDAQQFQRLHYIFHWFNFSIICSLVMIPFTYNSRIVST